MPRSLSNRDILAFWAPLAATWLMMAAEGPFLAAVIARLADPAFNLAAWGVAFAFAVLVEAPVIMLLSAATALVEDAVSYRRLRDFAAVLCAGSTLLLLVVLLPAVYDPLTGPVLALPADVAELTHGALLLFLPWPAAIGYRRFVQGVLIRSGRTGLVAAGTVLRLAAMGVAAVLLAVLTDLPGAWVGAAALAVGVCAEAGAARWIARHAIRTLLAPAAEGSAAADASRSGGRVASRSGGRAASRSGGRELDHRQILAFYYPLALTSMLGLVVQPMLTFFMGRAPHPVESLAVFPVVHALSFIFRALGLSYQDAAIALLGERQERFGELARFGGLLGLASTAALAAIAFTPLATVWFETISGLSPELAAFALTPTRVLVPVPALAVLFSFQRALLMKGRRTGPITGATAVEVAVIAALFVLLGWQVGMTGATAAFLAFVGGRVAANLYLVPASRAILGLGEAGSGRPPLY